MAERPRKAIITVGEGGFGEVLAATFPTFRDYADRFGYEIVVGAGAAAKGRPAAWAKVRLLQDALTRYDRVLWLDADVVILDPSTDIALELGDRHFQALVEEHYDAEHRYPNTGVWLVRRSQEAHDFLAAVWAQEEFIDHANWEQAAVATLLGYDLPPWTRDFHWAGRCGRVRPSPFFAGTRWLSPRWNSLVVNPVERPHIKHYAARSLDVRIAGIRADVASLSHLPSANDRAPGQPPAAADATESDDVWSRHVDLLKRELQQLDLAEKPFAFVDEDMVRDLLDVGLESRPFPQRNGQYWGRPVSDLAAIAELERARSDGAQLLVIAWPAFWWLEHYPEFERHLRSVYRCIWSGESAIAFDLRSPRKSREEIRSLDRLVTGGPFAGMMYRDAGSDGDTALEQRRFGAYRAALQPVVADLLERRFTTVVALDAGDGYYAVGFAYKSCGMYVYAFEPDVRLRLVARELAALNGVADDVSMQRAANLCFLEMTAGDDTLIFSPEAPNNALLRPDLVVGMAACSILVSVPSAPRSRRAFLERFRQTHVANPVGDRWALLLPTPSSARAEPSVAVSG